MDRHEAAPDSAAIAPPRGRRVDRSQIDPDPRKLDDLIADDHEARPIWEVVGQLHLDPLYQTIKAVEGHPGRTPIDPKILVAVWCYATREGISSARELERLCYEFDALKWLRGGVNVNYHTLADFRVDHGDWLQEQVAGIVAALTNEGLVNLNRVGQDGLRVRASAGASSFRREAELDEHLPTAQTQWDRLQKEFVDGTAQGTPRQQKARQRAAKERLERLKQAKQEHQKIQEAREARKKGDGREGSSQVFTPVKEAERQQQKGKDPDEAKPGDSKTIADWRERMGTEEGKTKYRARSKCEWSNAMARNRGLQKFWGRGLAKVKAAATWYALVQNLIRAAALRAQATA